MRDKRPPCGCDVPMERSAASSRANRLRIEPPGNGGDDVLSQGTEGRDVLPALVVVWSGYGVGVPATGVPTSSSSDTIGETSRRVPGDCTSAANSMVPSSKRPTKMPDSMMALPVSSTSRVNRP
jgi:hypothetical protein